jgi:hypothetical protein
MLVDLPPMSDLYDNDAYSFVLNATKNTVVADSVSPKSGKGYAF